MPRKFRKKMVEKRGFPKPEQDISRMLQRAGAKTRVIVDLDSGKVLKTDLLPSRIRRGKKLNSAVIFLRAGLGGKKNLVVKEGTKVRKPTPEEVKLFQKHTKLKLKKVAEGIFVVIPKKKRK